MTMYPVSLHVAIDPIDLIAGLIEDHSLNLIEFILALDADVSDEGFTIELVTALVKSLLADREGLVENLARKALEQALLPPIDEDAKRFGWSGAFTTTNYTKEWEEELVRQEILEQVVKLLGKLRG